MDNLKIYWRRHELSVGDYLMSHQAGLRDDFMRGFATLEEAARAQTDLVMKPWRLKDRVDRGLPADQIERPVTTNGETNVEAWRATAFRYERHDYMDISYTAPDSYKIGRAHV